MSHHKTSIIYVFRSALKLKYQTYSAFSKVSGIPSNRISEHLRGKRNMTFDQFVTYCQKLELEIVFSSYVPPFSYSVTPSGHTTDIQMTDLLAKHEANEGSE